AVDGVADRRRPAAGSRAAQPGAADGVRRCDPMSITTRNRLMMAVVWIFLLFLFLPILVVIPVSVTDKSYLSLPVDGVSLEHYVSLADPARGWVSSFRNSVVAAVATAIISTAIAAAFAVGAWIRS